MDAGEVEALERALLDPQVRHDRARLNALLAQEFQEFGSSGRVLDRAAIVEALLAEPARAFEMTNLAVRSLGAEAALVTYTSASDGKRALRSSVWVFRDGRWQLVFHQGTPVAG